MNLAISDKIGLNAYKSEVSTLVSLEGNDKILQTKLGLHSNIVSLIDKAEKKMKQGDIQAYLLLEYCGSKSFSLEFLYQAAAFST